MTTNSLDTPTSAALAASELALYSPLKRGGLSTSEARAWTLLGQRTTDTLPPSDVTLNVSPSPRRRLLIALQLALHYSHLDRFYVWTRCSQGAMILMYHSVATSEAAGWIDPSNHVAPCRFAQQLEFLARSRHVISLSALVEHLKRDTPLAPGTVVLTFDDGYLDNLTVAAPLLARWRLPATLFLTTAYIARGAPQWIDSLYSAFRARTRHQLVLSGSSPVVWQLQSPRSRLEAYRALADRLLVADAQRRAQLLAEVWEQLRPAAAPPRLTLTWGDVRTLRRDYPLWDFGVHTAEHLDLSTHVGPAARADLDRSRAEVGQELGTPPQHFSYPYSRATAEARRLVVECGFRSAVLWDRPELVRHGADPHALPRTQPPRSLGLFRFVTSGAYPDLPRALFGRPR